MLKFSILNLWFQQVYGSVSTRWSCCRNVSNSASLAANMDCSSAAVGNVCWLSEVDMVGVKGCLDELNDGNQSWVEWVMEAIELKMKGMIYFCDRDRRCNSTARESRRRLFTACVCVCVCEEGEEIRDSRESTLCMRAAKWRIWIWKRGNFKPLQITITTLMNISLSQLVWKSSLQPCDSHITSL